MYKRILTGTSICILVVAIIVIYYLGNFSDQYPSIHISRWMQYIFIATPICAFCCSCAIIGLPASKKKILVSMFIITCCLFLGFLGCIKILYNTKEAEYSNDYIKAAHIKGISLTQLEQYIDSGEAQVIYIGRKDCNECNRFEEKYNKLLGDCHVVMPGYYTNQDRDGKKSIRMYRILKHLKVKSVPALVYIKKTGGITLLNTTNLSNTKKVIQKLN